MGMDVHSGVLWIVGILVIIPTVNTLVGTDKMLIATIGKKQIYEHSYWFELEPKSVWR